MGIFSKISSTARLFGERVFGKATSEEAARLRREAGVAKAKQERAQREATEAARLARDLSARGRAGASTRASEAEAERRRQKIMELARREREAREEAEQERTHAEDLRRRAENVEREAARLSQQHGRAREAYLRTRKDLPSDQWNDTFQGPRPADPQINRNRKDMGAGLLPDELSFLRLGVPLSRFASSNVDTIVYDLSKKNLHILFLKRRSWYAYHGVSEELAGLIWKAVSKGVAIWDLLRVRGTKRGSRLPFTRGVAPPDYLPLDPESSAAQFGMHSGF